MLALTSEGWRLASAPAATFITLGATRWKTFEDARAALVLEADLALRRAAAGAGVTVGEA